MDFEEEEIKEKSKIKFFIKEENGNYYYFAYYYLKKDNGYIELSKNENEQHFLKIGKVGDIIINYFNMDFFNSLYDYSIFRKELNYLSMEDKMLELQNNFGILTSNLLLKYFNNIACNLVGFPKEYYDYANTLMKKIGITKKLFNFDYILTSFSQNNYVHINNKAIIQFISDIRDIIQLGYGTLKEKNQTNFLNLSFHNNTSQITYEILPNYKKQEMIEVYSINDIFTFLLFDIVQVNKYNIQINKCENCGKYFIPLSKSYEKYCNNPFSKSGRPCRDLSSEIKACKDELTRLYRNACKAQNGRKNRCKQLILNTEKGINIQIKQNWVDTNYDIWLAELKKEKIKCEKNEITIDDFKQYIRKKSSTNFTKKPN